MTGTRRALLGAALGLGASRLALAASSKAATNPDDPSLPAPSSLFLLLSRTSFGIRDDQWQRASQLGADAYLEEQLYPERINDSMLEAQLAANLPSLTMTIRELIDYTAPQGQMFQALEELRAATFLRQAFSGRQLFEVMVEFWTNHFNVTHVDGPIRTFKTADDRDIRSNALGRFGDLLHANARSPAMLYYLDNYSNVVTGPNENYARELMELHTLGVNGGYNEEDVKQVAKAFTGWTIGATNRATRDIGFVFNAATHDTGAKRVLGTDIAAGRGIEDGNQVLDLLIAHPSTASYLATKLVKRFVSDTPPAALVAAVANTYSVTGGDIKSMLRTLFASEEFKAALRAVYAQTTGNALRAIGNQLNNLSQMPYMWATPDGYPDTAGYWTNTSALLNRFNFGLGLVEGTLSQGLSYDLTGLVASARTPEQLVDRLSERILRRPLEPMDRMSLIAFAGEGTWPTRPLTGPALFQRARELIGVLLGSVYFQYR
jgi:uncharacterized protein (DUF1800 family)